MTNKKKKKRPTHLYIIIVVLALALAAMGGITFVSLNHLAALQTRVTELQSLVADMSESSASLTLQAEELESLQDQETEGPQPNPNPEPTATEAPQEPEQSAQAVPEPEPEPEPQEEGTLSPPSGSSFTEEVDESLNSLLAQVQGLLPQSNGTWSVYVCNLLKGTEGSISNQPMQAASLIKLFIMGAVYENYDVLSQQYGADSLNANLTSMITVSDNDAANTLVSYLGGGDSSAGMAAVNAFCQAHNYPGTSMGRLLLQSNENGDNYTTVEDCGRFLREVYQICNGTAHNATLSHADSMYALLKQQQRRNKIPARMPEGVQVANKTGELASVENDAGIIYDTANGIDLVVCFMSQNLSDVGAAQSTIAETSRAIYGYYNE